MHSGPIISLSLVHLALRLTTPHTTRQHSPNTNYITTRLLLPLLVQLIETMVEYIGAVAAIPQLAKYSYNAINSVPDFTKRLRKAPETLQQWHDHASLLTSLVESWQAQPEFVNQISSDLLHRFGEDAEELRKLFEKMSEATADGRFLRIKKHINVVRKEKELNQILASIAQRSSLISSYLHA